MDERVCFPFLKYGSPISAIEYVIVTSLILQTYEKRENNCKTNIRKYFKHVPVGSYVGVMNTIAPGVCVIYRHNAIKLYESTPPSIPTLLFYRVIYCLQIKFFQNIVVYFMRRWIQK